MSKRLVRGLTAPENSEVLSSGEFITLAFDQISEISLNLSFSKESDEVLEGMSDIMELMKAILLNQNINPNDLFTKMQQLSSTDGTFVDKKAVKEQDQNE